MAGYNSSVNRRKGERARVGWKGCKFPSIITWYETIAGKSGPVQKSFIVCVVWYVCATAFLEI